MKMADPDSTSEAPRRMRSFIAIPLPAASREVLTGWQDRALGEGLRGIAAANLHITLAFLGERDRDELDRAGGALRAAVRAVTAVGVSLTGDPIGMPRRRPRVIAFPVESPAMVRLRGALVAELAAAGIELEDGRPFRPHLSVARVRDGERKRRHGGRRLPAFGGLAPLGGGGHTFDAVRVALYRSELRSQGARYGVLADVELPRGSGG
jgi:2'-5' RNA ligase